MRMSMFDQGEFDFMPEPQRRPKKPERLFLGIFPDAPAAQEAQLVHKRLSSETGLTGRMLELERFHTSLLHVSDRRWLRSKDIYAAELAANRVRISPFELSFSQMGSFRGMPKKGRPLLHPLVLLADEGPVIELYEMLGAEFRKFRYPVPEHFRPHLTLSYDEQLIPMRSTGPITFVVKEFVLVHSKLWLTEYEVLRTWTLH